MRCLLRLPQVRHAVGLSRSEIYRRISVGQFPPPVPIGYRARAWDAEEIDAWIRARLEARDAKSTGPGERLRKTGA